MKYTLKQFPIALAFAVLGVFFITLPTHAAAPTAGIFNTAKQVVQSFPQVAAGSSIASGDVTGDAIPDIVVGSAPGTRATIGIFSLEGSLIRSINPYPANMRVGINVAVGDVNGDGLNEIIVSPRQGYISRIYIYNGSGTLLGPGFLAYTPRFRGGVSLTVGDVDGDGKKEIITAPMSAGGPHVRVFTDWGIPVTSFMAYEGTFGGGVSIGAVDYDGDGKDEVVTGPLSNRVGDIRVFNPFTRIQLVNIRPYGNFKGGVSLSTNNSGDGARVLLGAGRGGGPHVIQLNLRTQLVDSISYFPFTSSWRGGVVVSFVQYTDQVEFFASAGALQLNQTDLTALGAAMPLQFSGGSNSSWEKRSVSTSSGTYTVNIVHINLANPKLKVYSLAATTSTNCFNHPCATTSLQNYANQVGAFAAINGSYFCPADYSACSSYPGSFYWLWYNSLTKNFTNSYQNQFNNGPVIAFDTNNKYYYIKVARDWPGKDAFEAQHGVTLQAVFSNGPGLIYENANVLDTNTLDSKQLTVKSARSGIGFVGANDMYLVVASGATVVDLKNIMQSLGMEHAVDLDGGGSSALLYSGQYKVGPGRNMPNALVFAEK